MLLCRPIVQVGEEMWGADTKTGAHLLPLCVSATSWEGSDGTPFLETEIINLFSCFPPAYFLPVSE